MEDLIKSALRKSKEEQLCRLEAIKPKPHSHGYKKNQQTILKLKREISDLRKKEEFEVLRRIVDSESTEGGKLISLVAEMNTLTFGRGVYDYLKSNSNESAKSLQAKQRLQGILQDETPGRKPCLDYHEKYIIELYKHVVSLFKEGVRKRFTTEEAKQLFSIYTSQATASTSKKKSNEQYNETKNANGKRTLTAENMNIGQEDIRSLIQRATKEINENKVERTSKRLA
jgi:hypothetical protein